MTDTFGPTSGKQFAYYDPDSSSWRMWPDTGLWGSIAYSETWPKTGYMSDGQAFELPTLAPPTTGNGSSSSHGKVLPTPDTNPGGGGPLTTQERRAQGRTASVFNAVMEIHQANTMDPVKTLPTPVAQPSGNSPENHLRKKPGREVVTDLAIIVENDLLKSGGKVLPTPRTTDATNSMTAPSAMKHVADGFGSLPEVIGAKLLPNPGVPVMPTPTASDATGGGQHPSKRTGHTRQLIDTVLGLTSGPTAPLFDVGSD